MDPASQSALQWQSSGINGIWTDIQGATGRSYTAANITLSTSFRVKITPNPASPNCYTITENFMVNILQSPLPPHANNVIVCGDDPITALSVDPRDSLQRITWYDSPTGGTILKENSRYYLTETAGTYYAESYYEGLDCVSAVRTPVTLELREAPVLPGAETEDRAICKNEKLTLDAGISNVSYKWTPGGATTRTITVGSPATYTVLVTNSLGCTDSRSFVVTAYETPEIVSVTNSGPTITVTAAPPGEYEYSLGGGDYQESNVFTGAQAGMLKIYVRDKNQCGFDTEDFFLLIVPPYFTPNGDGFNDYFRIPGFSYIPGTVVRIFDRMGKLLCQLDRMSDSWDGTYGGKPLPADDYWYRIMFLNGKILEGHFSLLR